jgi:RNA polymerase sigma-70 factor (ECF subfamily)
LNASYNLARLLTGHDQDAQDVVQEACLRAFRAFDGFYGADGRAWLLTIVRNTAYALIQKNKTACLSTPFDEEIHGDLQPDASNPSAIMRAAEDAQQLQRAMENLPPEFREALVLRHQEGLSYNAIAHVVGIPLGTVMSRLARARARLRKCLVAGDKEVRA